MERIPQRKRYGDSGLILSRKVGEKIVIGDDITLVVIDIDMIRRQVRLGINAPKNIPVFRHELILKVEQEHGSIQGRGGQYQTGTNDGQSGS